jgi:hypothetical protein
VSWNDRGDLGTTIYADEDVRAQISGADGQKAGEDFIVHAQTAGSQNSSSITSLPNGGFVVPGYPLDPPLLISGLQ